MPEPTVILDASAIQRALPRIAHELAHTEQYERLGGIEPFLRQYLSECLTIGYPAAPMEQEAIAAARRLARNQSASQTPNNGLPF